VSGETGHVFHNRLTHTLQVAQVGRRLSEKFHKHQKSLVEAHGGVNPDVVEAACLAHDIGHPPFGHLAEEVLQKLVGEDAESFEGNAQSFRIVTTLAFRSEEYPGLNLTWPTLRAILKYPWTYSNRPSGKMNKWGAYSSEAESFRHATEHADGPVQRSAEAEIMDWADDRTYAIHDVEDFYRAGLIPLHLLKGDTGSAATAERERFVAHVIANRDHVAELSGVSDDDIDNVLATLLFTHFSLDRVYEGTRKDRAKLRSFTSQLVNRYINGLKLADPSAGKAIIKERAFEIEIAIVKQLT